MGMPGPIQIKFGIALNALAISSDGALHALGGSETFGQNFIYLLSCQTGAVVRDWQELPEPVRKFVFSPCGRWLASISSFGKSVRLYDLHGIDSSPRTLIEVPDDDMNNPTGMLFSPSGLHFAVGFSRATLFFTTRTRGHF